MPRIHSIEAFAQRVERATAQFASALRTLIKLIAPLKKRYQIRITDDGPTCVMVDLIDAKGYEAGLSVAADFSCTDVEVYLIVGEPNGDKGVHQIHDSDPVTIGLKKAIEYLARASKRSKIKYSA